MTLLYILAFLGLLFLIDLIYSIVLLFIALNKKNRNGKHYCNYCNEVYTFDNEANYKFCPYCGRPLTLYHDNSEYNEIDYLTDEVYSIFKELDNTDILILINIIKRGFYLRIERNDNDEETTFSLDSNLNELTSEERFVLNKFNMLGFEVYSDGKVKTFNNHTDIDIIGFEVVYKDEE